MPTSRRHGADATARLPSYPFRYGSLWYTDHFTPIPGAAMADDRSTADGEIYLPTPEIVSAAHVPDWEALSAEADANYVKFWEDRARELAVSYTHLRAHETRHDLVC